MNTEVIKEIANQLGIAVGAVTKEIIPAYASYMIATRASRIIVLAVLTIALLVLARFLFLRVRNMLIGSMKS